MGRLISVPLLQRKLADLANPFLPNASSPTTAILQLTRMTKSSIFSRSSVKFEFVVYCIHLLFSDLICYGRRYPHPFHQYRVEMLIVFHTANEMV